MTSCFLPSNSCCSLDKTEVPRLLFWFIDRFRFHSVGFGCVIGLVIGGTPQTPDTTPSSEAARRSFSSHYSSNHSSRPTFVAGHEPSTFEIDDMKRRLNMLRRSDDHFSPRISPRCSTLSTSILPLVPLMQLRDSGLYRLFDFSG